MAVKNDLSALRVAVVHDWLVSMRGGENVLEGILELFPQAKLFTLIWKRGSVSPFIESFPIKTSFLQKLPFAQEKHRHYLPLFPIAIQQLNTKDFDLIISTSHCVAKGVKTYGTPHLSYIHTPMRYMWDAFNDYFGKGRTNFIIRLAASLLRPLFQSWDKKSNKEVDLMLCNSQFIAERIKRVYQKNATVCYPFVNLDDYNLSSKEKNLDKAEQELLEKLPKDFVLCFGALVPYKRIDLAIQACLELDIPLVIAGDGPERIQLEKISQSKDIYFTGKTSKTLSTILYQKAKLFLFPGEEDFGITPLESLACGTPVLAYRGGGVPESIDTKVGYLFNEQNVASLVKSLKAAIDDPSPPTRATCRQRAEQFSKKIFQEEFLKSLKTLRS